LEFSEGFVKTDSFVHRLDPRVKVVVAFLFSAVFAVCKDIAVLVLALVLGFGVVFLARVPLRNVVRRLVPVNTFVLFLWLFLPFTVDGTPMFSFAGLAGTEEGVRYALQISIKSNAIVAVLIALVASTPVFTLGHALQDLKVPVKIVHLLFFTYRYVFVIYREFTRLVSALKVRSFQPGTNLHTYQTFAYLVGMLLVRSSERAQRVHNAMLCRGFRGTLYSLSQFSMNRVDVVSLLCMTILIAALGVFEWVRMG
jgi:cobalt/nickel transport system permease protein